MTERLAALMERTVRARRFYRRLLIEAILPVLEDTPWRQVATHFEDDAMDRQFWEIMARLLEETSPDQDKEYE